VWLICSVIVVITKSSVSDTLLKFLDKAQICYVWKQLLKEIYNFKIRSEISSIATCNHKRMGFKILAHLLDALIHFLLQPPLLGDSTFWQWIVGSCFYGHRDLYIFCIATPVSVICKWSETRLNLLQDSHKKREKMNMIVKTSGSQVGSPEAEGGGEVRERGRGAVKKTTSQNVWPRINSN